MFYWTAGLNTKARKQEATLKKRNKEQKEEEKGKKSDRQVVA